MPSRNLLLSILALNVVALGLLALLLARVNPPPAAQAAVPPRPQASSSPAPVADLAAHFPVSQTVASSSPVEAAPPSPRAETERQNTSQAEATESGLPNWAGDDGTEAETLVPVAFVEPQPEDRLSEDQLAALQWLRGGFASAMEKGPFLNPNTPAYYDRWKKLQQDFDEQFRTQLGDDAFRKYQDLARQSAPVSASK